MTTYMYCYNEHSQSGKLLAAALGIKRLKHQGSRFRRGRVINWGASAMPAECFNSGIPINDPACVGEAINKLTALQTMQAAGVSVPPFTTSKDEARRWIHEGEGDVKVVGRKVLNGSEGKGIVIIDNFLDVPDCPLYTLYIKKKKEFRVHVVSGQVIDIQQKVRKRDAEGPRDFHVRNTANGFIFIRDGIDVPADTVVEALKAVTALGLDLGAVDIIWNEHLNKSYVLEVNTAPGIEGSTVTKYKEALSALLGV